MLDNYEMELEHAADENLSKLNFRNNLTLPTNIPQSKHTDTDQEPGTSDKSNAL